MKKSILLLVSLVCITTAFSQNYTKPNGFAIHFILNDFPTAKEIRNNGIGETINQKMWYKTRRMNAGIGVSYIKGLSEHVDFAGTLAGSFLKYPIPDRVSNSADQKLLLEGVVTLNLKLLPDNFFAVPYFTAGIGASQYDGFYSAILPIGVGLQFKLGPDVFFLLNSQYRIPVTSSAEYHLYHSFGMAKTFPKKVEAPVAEVVVPVVLDKDGDGVLDADDRCPDVPGIAALQGCPDKDGDGIADAEDKCPDEAGIAKYQGCPIPDTDGDGINDEEDKCPSRPGVAENAGCPVIAKEVIEKINFAAKNVFFNSGSFKLMPKSYKSLNNVVAILKADESLFLDIDGHTDASGADDKNQVLSENRAKAVKDYLISKGIAESRLTFTGYGETKPVADNATAAGRAKNRRTEMTARNY